MENIIADLVVLRVNLTFELVFVLIMICTSVQCMQIYEKLMHCTSKSCKEQKTLQKSPSLEPLPEQKFREYYGIFRLGQYFTETWTPLKIALINMLSRATG